MANVTNGSLLIRLSDNKYPVSLHQVRNETKFIMPAEPDELLMEQIGYKVVDPVERPEGDVVTEGTPIIDGVTGRYTQVWEVRSYMPGEIATNLEEAKKRRLQILETNLKNTLEIGYEYIFSDSSIYHIQLRTGDRANLAGLRIKADQLVAAGEVNPVMQIMTYEDVSKDITPAEMVALTDEAFSSHTGIMKSKWIYKAQINAAETIEEIPTIPAIIPVYVA